VRQSFALVEEVLRDVAEDHPPCGADLFESCERDQAITGPDIEHDVAISDRCPRDHAALEPLEHRQQLLKVLLVAAMPTLEQPIGPLVLLGGHLTTQHGISGAGPYESGATSLVAASVPQDSAAHDPP
jgi:hypothetical protein